MIFQGMKKINVMNYGPKTMTSLNQKQLCHDYLNIAYLNFKNEHQQDFKHISSAYGELLFPSLDLLIEEIMPSEKDIFLDLGSGLGKACAYLFLRTAVRIVYGIELLSDLHQKACQVGMQMKKDLPDFFQRRELNFLCGDFLQVALPEASIALLASPCFDQRILQQLAERFDQAVNLRCLITLKPMDMMKRLRFYKALRIQASYDSALCYIYT